MFQYIEDKMNVQSIWALTFLFFLFNFGIHYPGQMTSDSNVQYSEAVLRSFSDMHPPVMAYLWSHLLRIMDAAPAMLMFHLAFHWLGLCLIALGLLKVAKKRSALAVLLMGFFPVLMYHNGYLFKDVGMASTFVAAFGLIFYFKIQNKQIPVLLYGASLVLLIYAFLVRANGIFALGPIIVFMYLNPFWQAKIIKPLLCSILITVAALPLSHVINKHLIEARTVEPIYALFLFDIVGIAKNANDLQILPASTNISKSDLMQCYTPFWWDPFSPWGKCKSSTQVFGSGNNISEDMLVERRALKDFWVTAIIRHPMAYLEHRLKVFNSELYFLVPAYQCQYASGCGVGQDVVKATKVDYIKSNFLFWPVFWLIIGIVAFGMQYKVADDKQALASKMLILSGVLYLMALSIIGIATVNRYAYWSILAISLGLILGYDQIKLTFYQSNRLFWIGLILVIAVVLAGLLARVFNFTYFVI